MAFTRIEKEANEKYKGINLGYRDYFRIPVQRGTPYISTVIDSNDRIPRMYLSFPVFDNKQNKTSGDFHLGNNYINKDNKISNHDPTKRFRGVVVASIEAKTLGKFLERQIHPKFGGSIGFIDRNGTIIYTKNQTFIGKNYFGSIFQSYLKVVLKVKENEFNYIINKAL